MGENMNPVFTEQDNKWFWRDTDKPNQDWHGPYLSEQQAMAMCEAWKEYQKDLDDVL